MISDMYTKVQCIVSNFHLSAAFVGWHDAMFLCLSLQVSIDAGDDVNFLNLPGTRTETIYSGQPNAIDLQTNGNKIGKLCYQVNSRVFGESHLFIFPFHHILGYTPNTV